MPHINSNVDLGASLKKLWEKLKNAEDIWYNGDRYERARAFGLLTGAVKSTLNDCTDIPSKDLYPSPNVPAANIDDLKDINI